jgi:hypothetical protein
MSFRILLYTSNPCLDTNQPGCVTQFRLCKWIKSFNQKQDCASDPCVIRPSWMSSQLSGSSVTTQLGLAWLIFCAGIASRVCLAGVGVKAGSPDKPKVRLVVQRTIWSKNLSVWDCVDCCKTSVVARSWKKMSMYVENSTGALRIFFYNLIDREIAVESQIRLRFAQSSSRSSWVIALH